MAKDQEKSSNNSNKQLESPKPKKDKLGPEKDYVLYDEFPRGDVRRYGVFPDSSYASTHPISKKSKLMTALDLGETYNLELFFPKGYYNTALLLDSRKNMNLRFDKAEFDLIRIARLQNKDSRSENVKFKGTVISYERLGLMHARNVQIDSVLIKSDTVKSVRKMRSRGCQIYSGTEDLRIGYMMIEDFGSGDERYNNNHAALAVDGYRDNPRNMHIKELHIKSTDRHGIYLTGTGHRIDKITIDRFGIGSAKDMAPMQDASLIEHKLFSAIWINRCYDSNIGTIQIDAKNSDGYFTANFDEGDTLRPVRIKHMTIKNFDRTLPLYFAKNTGVIVENLKK